MMGWRGGGGGGVGVSSNFFGSEILAKSDFGSIKDAGIFSGRKEKQKDFFGLHKKELRDFFGHAKKTSDFFG